MSSLIPFDFDSHAVRVLLKDDAPWFCLTDVCRALDVDRSSNLVKSLDPKGWVSNLTLTGGGSQSLAFIHEPNLYRLIFRSDRPEARRFQDWVFNEVLPAIRQTGAYRAPAIPAQADVDALRAQLLRLRALVFDLKPEFGVIARCQKAGLTRAQTAGALGWGAKRVRRATRVLADAGLLPARDSMQLLLLAA